MGFEALHNAIRKKFRTDIQVPENIVVVYDNDPTKRPEDANWIRFTVRPGESVQISLGDRKRFRHPGVAIAQIFVRVEKGDKEALVLADKINVKFRSQRDNATLVVYRTPRVTVIGRDGKWWQVNVTCPFYQDDFQNP